MVEHPETEGEGPEAGGEGPEPGGEEPDEEEGLSFEDLGAAFARAAAEIDPELVASPADAHAGGEAGSAPDAESGERATGAASHREPRDDRGDDEDGVGTVTPEAIVEGALFVGHPENQAFSEQRLASLMRDVTPEEVVAMIDRLNASYREAGQAFRIVRDEQGYRMTTAPELDSMRQQFLGKVRETRLTQLAVEVLSLVAYQPGITAQTVRDQRGRDCGSVLSQLVRRRLLEIRREPGEASGRTTQTYYPTERFLALFHLESLDDLPQVDPFDQTTE